MNTPVNEDDARDLADARAGDPLAFARLYDRHAPVVLALCRRKQSSPSEAEDAMQETFIRAYRRLGLVEGPEKLRSWLYGIAARVCSERRRASQRRQMHESKATADGRAAASAPCTSLDGVAHAEQLAQLGAALDQLDERQRLAIHLYYLESDPVSAAADALGLSRSGYYKLLARARTALAAALTGTLPTGITPGITP